MEQRNWRQELLVWHEFRIRELYPLKVQEELRRVRLKWLSGVGKAKRFV